MTTLYVPPGCSKLSEIKEMPQIRLGIQGYGGTGKTWSALTFPNPVVVNLDRGLGCHIGREDVIEVPFYKPEFCKTLNPRFTPPDLKDVMLRWLETEGLKLQPGQTLVWDGNTSTQNAYHKWYEANKMSFLSANGRINEFAEWAYKKTYYGELLELLKLVRCHVVFIAHEVDRPDKPLNVGDPKRYSGKIRPLITGQVGDELVAHFTDWFRQQSADKPTDFKTLDESRLAQWRLTKAEFEKMCKEVWPDCPTMFFWQTLSDDNFDGKCSSLVNYPKFIPAHYASFEKYRRSLKIST